MSLYRNGLEAFVSALYGNEVEDLMQSMGAQDLFELHDESMKYMANDVLVSCTDAIVNNILPNHLRKV